MFVQIYLQFLLLNWQNKYEEGKQRKCLWASQNNVNRYERGLCNADKIGWQMCENE